MGFWDAVASAGPYANNLRLAPDRIPHQHLITQFFTGQMLFLTPSQQCQSTEGKVLLSPATRGLSILAVSPCVVLIFRIIGLYYYCR